MSASSQSQPSTSPANTQATGCVVDPLDLLDFSEYDGLPYQSPSVSPTTNSKPQFNRRAPSATPSIMPSGPQMHGPSHRYDQYKQQTPFVPGALATTMAVNQQVGHVGYTLDYSQSRVSPNEDMFDFNAGPSPNMELDFDSQADPSFYFPSETINPNAIGGREQSLPSPPALQSNIGRMYPGMHQQQALAKAQAQQRQQQQIIQQQQQQRQQAKQKGVQPSDPMVEQKITQLLNSMRAKPNGMDAGDSPMLNMPRPRKDEDDMDEDERLLNSEEGKKLSSKERRQLRNKVSARAFRSRRKEYITQLEAEIAGKVTENGDLRAQNRALMEENKRLSDLTRMLLSSPSFSNFLDHLSQNPNAAPQQQQLAAQMEQRQSEQRQMPKDVNAYAAARQAQQQQIGMVMIPEQTMDFSMLNIAESSDAYNYQPQVFTVLETPEMPEIDTAVLSGKTSDIVRDTFEAFEKAEISISEAPILLESAKLQGPQIPAEQAVTEKVVADLDSDIFDDETTGPSQVIKSPADGLSSIVIPSEKASVYELVDSSNEEAVASSALARVSRLTASIEATMARLERLTVDL
ncbi:putative BZIP domain-containing protein [Seiridium unicorne]|uniref:BZIP domain-containing protein n=1 Tax=Seiridium unicorne TaxID=138068 RepID=A0ABR2V2H3_9PEZI